MRLAWITLKALLTLLLSGLVFVMGFDLIQGPTLRGVLIMALLMIFAVLLWADYSSITPQQVLVFFIGVGLGLIFLSHETYTGDVEFPKSCRMPSGGMCELENLLFHYGGSRLAALPSLLLGIFMLWMPYSLFKNRPSYLLTLIKKEGWEFLDKN